jgi:hypothetical protein
MSDKLYANEACDASVTRNSGIGDIAEAHGVYHVQAYSPNGELKWEDTFPNTVTTTGKNFILDTVFSASVVPTSYVGLISSTGYSSSPVAGDTMTSHSGWFETSGSYYPTVANRTSASWGNASSGTKALSPAASFSIITNGGTAVGAFIVSGSDASSTVGQAKGVLISSGSFSGGNKTLGVGDTLNVSYSLSL